MLNTASWLLAIVSAGPIRFQSHEVGAYMFVQYGILSSYPHEASTVSSHTTHELSHTFLTVGSVKSHDTVLRACLIVIHHTLSSSDHGVCT